MRRAAPVALMILCAPGFAHAQCLTSASAARRVVSLHPAATEILLALGASDALVARMEGDVAALAELPSVGEMLTPDLEVLASVQPDMVIAWVGSDLAALARVVGRRGGRVEGIAVDRLADVTPAIARIGDWVGRPDEAAELSAAFASTLAEARAHRAQRERLRVLWIVWSEPIVAAGSGTFIHDVIEVAGGENAASSAGQGWPRLGPESLVALDPDVLVWPVGPGMFARHELPDRTGWRALRAVSAGRVLSVDAERFHDTGPQIADAALDFTRRLQRMAGP